MVTYRKADKPGRIRGPRGPRDLQTPKAARQDDEFVRDLLNRVTNLTDEVSRLRSERTVGAKGEKKYTDDEFNDELIKQLQRETKFLEKEWQQEKEKIIASYEAKLASAGGDTSAEVAELEKEVMALSIKLAAKDEVIEALKAKPVQTVVYSDNTEGPAPNKDINAPEMEGVVIDPSESGVEMESHIKVKSDSGSDQVSKLEKLKKLGIGG